MAGISQDVTDLERQLQTTIIERDRLKGENEHLKTVNGIQAETIDLLQSERDRYFRAATEIGTLCETLADGLVSGVKKWQENKQTRARPGQNTSRLVAAASGSGGNTSPPQGTGRGGNLPMTTIEVPTIEAALSRLAAAEGRDPHDSSSLLPSVTPG